MATKDEHNALEYSRLTERIDAQLEVHEKYTQDFAKIIELLERNGSRIEELKEEYKNAIKSDLKGVSDNVAKLIEDLLHHNETAKTLLKDIAFGINEQSKSICILTNNIDLQKKSLDTLLIAINDILNKLNIHDDDKNKKLVDLKNALSGLKEQLSEHHTTVIPVAARINTLYDSQQRRKSFWGKAVWVVGVVSIGISIILGLIQANIISVTWFPK